MGYEMTKYDFALLLYEAYIESVKYNMELDLISWSPVVIFKSHIDDSKNMTKKMDDARLNLDISQLWKDRRDIKFTLWDLAFSLVFNNSFWLFGSYNNKIVEGQHRFMALQILAIMGAIDWHKSKILHIEKTREAKFTLLIPIELTPNKLIDMAKTMPVAGDRVRALAELNYDQIKNITYFNKKAYYKISNINATEILFTYHSIIFPLLWQNDFFNTVAPFGFLDLHLTMPKEEIQQKIKEYEKYYGGIRHEVYRRNF